MSLLPGFEPTAAEARAEEPDTAERQDDPTPRGIIRAVLEAAIPRAIFTWRGSERMLYSPEEGKVRTVRTLDDANPVRVLDVCAGYGAWASELRALAMRGHGRSHFRGGAEPPYPVHITGVELHAPRETDLRKWCDEAVIRDWFDFLRDHHELPAFDIAIGNPHFTALTGKLTPGDDFGEYTPSMPDLLLEHAPAVLLLHTQQAFLRGEAGRAAWRRCPPAAAWLVPGSVKFRSGVNPKCPRCRTVNPATLDDGCKVTYCVKGCGAKLKSWGSDARCYQVSLWLRGHEGPTTTHLLGELTAAERQWTVPPGSETPSADLPAAPGWTP